VYPGAGRQIEAIEGDIDERVFALYGVTASEKREVESFVAEARAESSGAELPPESENAE
jgi:hypothetical protein